MVRGIAVVTADLTLSARIAPLLHKRACAVVTPGALGQVRGAVALLDAGAGCATRRAVEEIPGLLARGIAAVVLARSPSRLDRDDAAAYGAYAVRDLDDPADLARLPTSIAGAAAWAEERRPARRRRAR